MRMKKIVENRTLKSAAAEFIAFKRAHKIRERTFHDYGITFPSSPRSMFWVKTPFSLYKWLSENTKFEGFGMSPMAVMMNGIAKKMDKGFSHGPHLEYTED